MERMKGFIIGLFVAVAFPVLAQVGGAVAEIVADDVFVNDDLVVTDDATINGLTILTLPSYADDTAACAGGLIVGQIYNDSDAAAAAEVVSVQACS